MRSYSGRNKAGKLVSMWKLGNHWVVGVQGTSLWFSYDDYYIAKYKFDELINGKDI